MAIREDLVASAVQFLQDPSVASSPLEKRVAFLQAKNLTQEEVDAAISRCQSTGAVAQSYQPPPGAVSAPPAQQSPAYYGQPYPQQQYPPYAWPQQPPAPPRRDWRDWFIMATVVSGVSYGMYSLGKRYIYPLIAPPTPGRLEQDKKSIDEKFEQTFALVEQLAKDTESLKAAEKERTEKLDTAIEELETVIRDLKTANRRRDDEGHRMRDDVQNLKDSIPRAMNNQKDLTDNRLREVNAELKSLKTLITQRMNPNPTSQGMSSYLRQGSGNVTSAASTPAATSSGTEKADPVAATESKAATVTEEQAANNYQNYVSGLNRSSPFNSGMAQSGKPTIPSWQMAMSKGSTPAPAAGASSSTTTPAPAGVADATASGAQDA